MGLSIGMAILASIFGEATGKCRCLARLGHRSLWKPIKGRGRKNFRCRMALGLYTGQARQDVVEMGEQHITRECDQDCEIEILNWVRKKTKNKTGFQLAIPVHPELRRVIDATPSKHLTFLVTELGAPFTVAGFGGWFRDQCNAAGLPHCSFHGLRKAAATRLVDAGCDVVEAAAITGHANLKELQRYIETRDRKKAARRAMAKLVMVK